MTIIRSAGAALAGLALTFTVAACGGFDSQTAAPSTSSAAAATTTAGPKKGPSVTGGTLKAASEFAASQRIMTLDPKDVAYKVVPGASGRRIIVNEDNWYVVAQCQYAGPDGQLSVGVVKVEEVARVDAAKVKANEYRTVLDCPNG